MQQSPIATQRHHHIRHSLQLLHYDSDNETPVPSQILDERTIFRDEETIEFPSG
jgi:hypothetical protein